jgi:hypothetical protein
MPQCDRARKRKVSQTDGPTASHQVIYQGRALPLAWRVRQCPKGHFPEALHLALVERVSDLIPAGSKGVFLGDGEFDTGGPFRPFAVRSTRRLTRVTCEVVELLDLGLQLSPAVGLVHESSMAPRNMPKPGL